MHTERPRLVYRHPNSLLRQQQQIALESGTCGGFPKCPHSDSWKGQGVPAVPRRRLAEEKSLLPHLNSRSLTYCHVVSSSSLQETRKSPWQEKREQRGATHHPAAWTCDDPSWGIRFDCDWFLSNGFRSNRFPSLLLLPFRFLRLLRA